MSLQLRSFLAVAMLFSASAKAQLQTEVPEATTAARKVTFAEYREHLDQLKQLVQSCRDNASACDATKVGDDEYVEEAGFQARWSWLRDTLSNARNQTKQNSEASLQEAATRLNEDAALAVNPAPHTANTFPQARRQADDVLSRPEFRTVSQESYLEREIAKFAQFIDELFSGVSRFGKRSPWLVPLVEWSSITLAAAGLLTWVFRTMQRQRFAVRIESTAIADAWQKESDNWAELARTEAARHDWRAAVHCLYWATIVMMEGRKLWRQNRARTPREYLLLLQPGSPMQQLLQRLTRIFERIWYGLRPAAETDYANALALFEELRSA